MEENPVVFERIEEVYTYLVNLTEYPYVIHNKPMNDLLHKLLQLMEYLQDYDTENPVPEWFE